MAIVTLRHAVGVVVSPQLGSHMAARASDTPIVRRAVREPNVHRCPAGTGVAEIARRRHAGAGPMHLVILAARKHRAFGRGGTTEVTVATAAAGVIRVSLAGVAGGASQDHGQEKNRKGTNFYHAP